jgi:molybdenum cofactor biosynthesis protein MoaC
MIDVSFKSNSLRYALAQGTLTTSKKTINHVKKKSVPKGDVLEVARAAGIQAAKKTSDWIVFCHPIPLDWIGIQFELKETQIIVTAEVKAIWKTGVEMEAMTAVSAALLNIYDMLKPLEDKITFSEVKLINKQGGKSQFTDLFDQPFSAAVLVISGSTFAGKREDKSGRIIKKFLEQQPVNVEVYEVLPDVAEKITNRLKELVDVQGIQLIFTTGGTGLGPKDYTPEATRPVLDKEIPGISETIRRHGRDRTPFAMLSREIAGLRKDSMIINLPGSSKGAKESLEALFPGLLHGFPMMWGGSHTKNGKWKKGN